jgi:ABC-type dipeptide/oligopeptide/nickel transport system permease component
MKLSAYFAQRAGFALATVILAVTMNFFIFRAAPGDPTTTLALRPGGHAYGRALMERFGLAKPIWTQYWDYITQLARGHLGVSIVNQQPVASNLVTALSNTALMVLTGLVIATILGVIVGVLAAWAHGTVLGSSGLLVALATFAMPTQWLGLLMIAYLGGILPAGGMTSPFLINPTVAQHLLDIAGHMILPSLTLAISLFGANVIIVRSSVLEALSEDFTVTAMAKGLSSWGALTRHALRAALLPITSLTMLSLGNVVGGALLVETVFSWPGIGRAVYEAVVQRDYPMLQGAFLILTVSVIACNFLADLLAVKLDPRVTA